MHLVCPECAAINRVPDDRLVDGPVCGMCKTPLLSPHPLALTDSTFSNYVMHTGQPVVVDFWAEWCGPCKTMGPQFAEAAKLIPMARFAKVDTEAATQTAARFGIRSIPTIVVFAQGKEVTRQSGAMRAGDIVRWVQSVIDSRP